MNASGTNPLPANFTALSLIASHIPRPREPVRIPAWRRAPRRGATRDTLFLATLAEVRYQTTQSDRRLVFGPGGRTTAYNIHLHGGDITLRPWTGREHAL